MKLKNFLAMMVIALCAVACSDDDDNDQNVNLAQEVAGTYNGYTSAKFSYSPSPTVTPKEKVEIADKGDSKVDVTLTSNTWGEFKITDTVVTKDGNAYKMEGTGKATLEMSGHAAGEYEFTLTGSVEQGKKNPSFVVSLTIMGGTTITFIEGDAPVKEVITGSYKGKLAISVSGEASGDPIESTVAIAADEAGETVTVTLGSFSISGMGGRPMTFGDIKIAAVKATTTNYTEYTLSGDVDAAVSMGESTVNMAGTITGTIKSDKSAKITFSLTPGAMPMPIVAVFTTVAE